MRLVQFFVLLGFGAAILPAATVTLNNGISGVGRWEVAVNNAASSSTGNITHAGGTSDVIYSYRNGVKVGSSTPFDLGNTTTTQNALDSSGASVSAGSFAGTNGSIAWTATSWIAPGSPSLTTRFDFNSASAFGAVRFFNYLDEDVISSGNNNLIVFGSPASADLQLLTVHSTTNLGVAQTAAFDPTGASFYGWGVHRYGTGHDYDASPNGDITASAIGGGDPRYPGRPAYGTADMISVLAFDLNPLANSASITLSLGGSPTGQPIPTTGTPEPATVAMLGSGLLAVAVARKKGMR